MEHDKDLAIVIAWPEIPTRGDERWMKFFKRIGLVKNLHFKVGHAAIVLVNHDTGALAYYDFGRYVTPLGYGRARSAQSDPRLELTTKARIDAPPQISNLRMVLDEMHVKREATHGAGTMYFSIADSISFDRASAFAERLVSGGPIKYGAIASDCNSCSRYVAQILLAGLPARHASRRQLLFPESMKPSPMSNVVNARADRKVYAFDGHALSARKMSRFRSFAFQAQLIGESLSNAKTVAFPPDHIVGHVSQPPRVPSIPQDAQWLGGIGEGAWYAVEATGDKGRNCLVTRYDAAGARHYTARYVSDIGWNPDASYHVTHHTEYRYVTLVQGGKTVRLSLVTDQATAQNNHAFAI